MWYYYLVLTNARRNIDSDDSKAGIMDYLLFALFMICVLWAMYKHTIRLIQVLRSPRTSRKHTKR